MASSIPSIIEQSSPPQVPLTPKSAKIKELEESLAKTKLLAQDLAGQNARQVQIIEQQQAQNETLHKEVVFFQSVAQRFRNAAEQIQNKRDKLLIEKIKDEVVLREVAQDNRALVANQGQLENQNQWLRQNQQQLEIQNNQLLRLCEGTIQDLKEANATVAQHNQIIEEIVKKPRILAACNILINGSQGFVDSVHREIQQNNHMNQNREIEALDAVQIAYIV